MTGDDTVWVAQEQICGLGHNVPEAFSAATPLGEAAVGNIIPCETICNSIIGLIPGSIGETSVIAIALGALLLLFTGIASWKTMLSVFVGGGLMGWLLEGVGGNQLEWWHHFVLGGFAFGAVFMATDPVTSAQTNAGKWIYGFMVGALAVLIRVVNPAYPEGMMLAILFMNALAPLIDYFVVERNIARRKKLIKNVK
jgi:Na+-transporting NADH:ubiquinone oxidoreductase subunit B